MMKEKEYIYFDKGEDDDVIEFLRYIEKNSDIGWYSGGEKPTEYTKSTTPVSLGILHGEIVDEYVTWEDVGTRITLHELLLRETIEISLSYIEV